MTNPDNAPPFQYLLQVTPLGLLYGSSGRFLSPENLVGRSGDKFPPNSPALSGVFAQQYNTEGPKGFLPDLRLAGPFWAENHNIQNFYVPLPLTYLVEKGTDSPKPKEPVHRLYWHSGDSPKWQRADGDNPVPQKYAKNADYWLPIQDWENPKEATKSPWKYHPHLHPGLEEEQRHTKEGDLFLENAVQVDPDVSLVYLANHSLESGWYRFGGEGHLVEVQCHNLGDLGKNLLEQSIVKAFALITDGVWGSNDLSYRAPQDPQSNPKQVLPPWKHEALLTERPNPFRYRLGGRLSKGRYAVPAGSVYVLKEPFNKAWHQWDVAWFPQEFHYSFKRWGCGLALPLPNLAA